VGLLGSDIIDLHILALALNGGKWTALFPGHFIPLQKGLLEHIEEMN